MVMLKEKDEDGFQQESSEEIEFWRFGRCF